MIDSQRGRKLRAAYVFSINLEKAFIDNSTTSKQHNADQADARRTQLVDIAAKLIDEHGVDAAKFSRIAELAGCTRSLVYHYFPKTSDLHTAIGENFYNKLSAMINETDQKHAVVDRYKGSGGTTNALFSAVFDLFEENGIAPLILRYNAELNPDYSPDSEDKWYFENIYQGFLEEHLKIPKLDSALLIEHCLNIIKTCFLYYRQGRITRDQAIIEIDTSIGCLLTRFQAN